MKPVVTVTDEDLSREPDEALCLEKVLPEMMALAEAELKRVNLDIPKAVPIALKTRVEVMPLRSKIIEKCQTFDVKYLDRLEDYAWAARESHTRVQVTSKRVDDGLAALLADAVELRDSLRADVDALCRHGKIDRNTMRSYTGLNGFGNVASDLRVLHTILRDHLPAILGKWLGDEADLERAGKLAIRITRLSGPHEQRAAASTGALEMRRRAFTLFARAYDEVRCVVSYIRWRQEDADELAPSLYVKARSRKSNEAPEAPPAQVQVPATPSVNVADNKRGVEALRAPEPGSDPFRQ
jgi:hypothetical protein